MKAEFDISNTRSGLMSDLVHNASSIGPRLCDNYLNKTYKLQLSISPLLAILRATSIIHLSFSLLICSYRNNIIGVTGY